MKKLNELFPEINDETKITGIYDDSRYVSKNSIFFCIEGFTTDGHKYADDAVFLGAKAIVHSKKLRRTYPGIIYIKKDDVMGELNRVTDLFYDHPSYKMTVIGVTGSHGKAVVAMMVRDGLNHFLKTGYIGSSATGGSNDSIQPFNYTTPTTLYLHRNLALMVDESVKGVTMEVSSYGISLRRVDSVHFNIMVLTSLAEEHLEFYGTYENLMDVYLTAFKRLDETATAVINADEVRFKHMLDQVKLKCHMITYGLEHKADIMAHNIKLFIDHSEFDLEFAHKVYRVKVPVIGYANISNYLAFIATLYALEMPPLQIMEAMQYVKPVEGRMEYVPTNRGFHIIIDNCAEPDSYEAVFKFARRVRKGRGRIIAVFGAPGRRALSRRESLGLLANQYCSHVILTQEDERDDDIEAICEEIQDYITDITSVIITDRKVAITQAVEMACKNDIILILGKGLEQFMRSMVGNEPYPGDKYVAQQAIDAVFNGGNYDEV